MIEAKITGGSLGVQGGAAADSRREAPISMRSVTWNRGAWAMGALLCVVGLVATDCGGSTNEGVPPPRLTPSTPLTRGTPTIAPSFPPGATEGAGRLLYLDPSGVVAADLTSGQRLRLPPDRGASSLTGIDCTRDGLRAAYVYAGSVNGVSRVTIVGQGAVEQPIQINGLVQGVAWAPDGQKIALNVFDSAGIRLWLLDVSSREMTPLPLLPGDPGLPRWSPDGHRLVFDVNKNGESQLYTLDIGTALPTRLTNRPSGAFSPDWSPDGQTILFTAPDKRGFQQLFAVDSDGQNERELTSSSLFKASPRWAVNGMILAYAGTIPPAQLSRLPMRPHNMAVWVANTDGSGERALTDVALDAILMGWCLPGPWLDNWIPAQ